MATAARLTLDATTGQSAGGTDAGPSGGVAVLLPQADGTIIYGPSDVTTANGARHAVTAGSVVTLNIPSGEAVYLLCASGTLAVDVLRFG